MTDFGDIRSTLQNTPSASTWKALCEQVEDWASAEPEVFEQQALGYLRDHLCRWPVALCKAPQSWLESLFAEQRIHPGFGIVRCIELRDRDLEEEDVESIAYCPWSNFVSELDFSRSRRTVWRRHNLYTTGISTIAQSPHLKNLRVFKAAGHHIRPEGLRLIGQREQFMKLHTLDMSFNNFGFLRSVGQEPWCLTELETLILKDTELSWPGIDYLLNTGVLPNLTTLDLSSNELEDQGIDLLFDTLNYPKLRILKIADCKLHSLGANILAHMDGLNALEYLDVSDNALGQEGASSLARSKAFGQLKGLGFRNNQLSSSGLIEILDSPHLGALTQLELSNNLLDHRAIERLAKWHGLEQCEILDLSFNRLDDDAIISLLRSPHIGGVRTLLLQGNQISDEGARQLAQATCLSELEVLNLNDNQITDRGFRPFATRREHGNLKTLHANGNPYQVEQMQDIIEHPVPFQWLASLETGWQNNDWDDEWYEDDYE